MAAVAVPVTTAIMMTRQMVMRSNAASDDRASALDASTSKLTIMMPRRLARSAIAPPTSPRRKVGALPMKLTVPSHDALRVRA